MHNIEITYSELKNLIISKGLTWQFTEDNESYKVFAVDSTLIYNTILLKAGFEPHNCATCTTDTTDFETNYKAVGNPRLTSEVHLTGTNLVTPALTNFAQRSFDFAHNFCDKTTWWGDATRVTGEAVGTGDGVQTVFNLANTNIICMNQGKVTDEDLIVPTAAQTGSDFFVHVYLDAVEQTEDDMLGGTTNDYSVNYATGAITFATAPASTVAVTADYFYESGSTHYLRPPTGFKTVIVKAEAQFSKNLDMTDTLISAVFTYDPGQGAPPAKFEYPNTRIAFKRFYDFINYTNGSFPIIPAMGGATRGIVNDILQVRWEYTTAIELPDSAGAELRVWLGSNTPFLGEIGTITFYGYDVPE